MTDMMGEPVDFLCRMLENQKGIWDKLRPRYPQNAAHLHLALSAHLMMEVCEFMDTAPWKAHRTQQAQPRHKQVEELVDCVRMIINLALLHGIDLSEFMRIWETKQRMIWDRIREQEDKEKTDDQVG